MMAERRAKMRKASRTTQKKSRSSSWLLNSSFWVLFAIFTLFSCLTRNARAWNMFATANPSFAGSILRSGLTQPGIDFTADLRKIVTPQSHAARHRFLASRNCSAGAGACSETQRLDSRQLARPDSLRRNAVADHSFVPAGASALECAGNLPFRRRVWRARAPLAGNDSRLW